MNKIELLKVKGKLNEIIVNKNAKKTNKILN